MEIWILWLWSASMMPVEGGQYQSESTCLMRGLVQSVEIPQRYSMQEKVLHWACEPALTGDWTRRPVPAFVPLPRPRPSRL